MDVDYLVFILGYDDAKIFEIMGLLCDEAYELAKKIAIRYKDHCVRHGIDKYYATFRAFIDSGAFLFNKVWEEMRHEHE